MLSPSQVAQFERDGYLVIPDFFNVKGLRKEAALLLESCDVSEHLTKFTTSDDNHIGDDYFLGSGDKIRYFTEEKADLSKIPKEKAINKIGHALHELNPVFKEFSQSPKIAAIARSLGYRSPAILQSMLIFKQPEIGGEVPGHIDSTFLYTEPPSATGCWFALEDCTLSNGCMYFAPGSHKKYPKVAKRFVRDLDTGTGTKMVYLDTDHSEPAPEEYVAAPVSKGSLVLIHGLVHHKSGPNLSPDSRWIYTFHLIENDLPYPKDNWLLPTPAMPFTKLY
ncbi:hypothetical protein HDU91_000317 [Kappamyces sp. JEL0680]|nr:hypothetical protein HDU91_000317 [Kappamyces sp. JEL0680]